MTQPTLSLGPSGMELSFDSERDICARKHHGAETSVEANKRVNKANDRTLVLRAITESRNGLTCDQLAAILDCGQNQISGRFTELAALGFIQKSGERRPTRSGNKASVYVLAK